MLLSVQMRQKKYLGRLRSARTGKFQKIVIGANQCPLASDFVEPTKQELAETLWPA
jgi:hypothetical protein